MALFRIGAANEAANFIHGDGIYLRPGEMSDYAEWAALRETSRAFLTPWEPIWPADDLTRAAFRRRLKRHTEEIERDESYPFLIFRENDDTLIGGLTLSQVRRGVAQASTLGYWMGEPYSGKGHMSRAVRATVAFAFATLRLHRVEAACLPHNVASIQLLERVGFKREGYARSYLRINGIWQDHVLFALVETDPMAARIAQD
ncbi:MAG TPA: GNAT family protein [Beijerinckiaceae bacterium]|jgi:ribosomal-protein-alanine N-acetyltransferase|nr:GNAT family protein [Beijerinckiaceae bacterium]